MPIVIAVALVAVALTTTPAVGQPLACGAGHLATIAPDGSLIAGSKDAVRRAALDGRPLRVGWTLDFDNDATADITHWSDATFLTEFEGEVFAQLPDIQRQRPVRGQKRVLLPRGRQRWSAVVGTTGLMEGHFDDDSEPSTMGVRSIWCLDPRIVSPGAGHRNRRRSR